MPDWSVWLIVAAFAAVAEMVIFTGFILGPIAIAAAITAVVAALDGSPELQVATFTVLTIVSLLILRPIAKRHLLQPSETRTGADALVGVKGVIEQEAGDLRPALARISGETWTVRPALENTPLPLGSEVIVEQVSGATAIVSPIVPTNPEETR